MAFTGITATEAEIDQKTGADVNTAYTDTMKTQALLQAESVLNSTTRINWSDWYATAPNIDFKSIVTLYTASYVAKEAINYDIDAFGAATAETMLDVLSDNMAKALKVLSDKSVQKFVGIIT